jgi:hypothetical protein
MWPGFCYWLQDPTTALEAFIKEKEFSCRDFFKMSRQFIEYAVQY